MEKIGESKKVKRNLMFFLIQTSSSYYSFPSDKQRLEPDRFYKIFPDRDSKAFKGLSILLSSAGGGRFFLFHSSRMLPLTLQ